jgi:hypothetical protein
MLNNNDEKNSKFAQIISIAFIVFVMLFLFIKILFY